METTSDRCKFNTLTYINLSPQICKTSEDSYSQIHVWFHFKSASVPSPCWITKGQSISNHRGSESRWLGSQHLSSTGQGFAQGHREGLRRPRRVVWRCHSVDPMGNETGIKKVDVRTCKHISRASVIRNMNIMADMLTSRFDACICSPNLYMTILCYLNINSRCCIFCLAVAVAVAVVVVVVAVGGVVGVGGGCESGHKRSLGDFPIEKPGRTCSSFKPSTLSSESPVAAATKT